MFNLQLLWKIVNAMDKKSIEPKPNIFVIAMILVDAIKIVSTTLVVCLPRLLLNLDSCYSLLSLS